MYSTITTRENLASKVVLIGTALLLCEAAWDPERLTTSERFFVLLPFTLNALLSWTVCSSNEKSAVQDILQTSHSEQGAPSKAFESYSQEK